MAGAQLGRAGDTRGPDPPFRKSGLGRCQIYIITNQNTIGWGLFCLLPGARDAQTLMTSGLNLFENLDKSSTAWVANAPSPPRSCLQPELLLKELTLSTRPRAPCGLSIPRPLILVISAKCKVLWSPVLKGMHIPAENRSASQGLILPGPLLCLPHPFLSQHLNIITEYTTQICPNLARLKTLLPYSETMNFPTLTLHLGWKGGRRSPS